MFWCIKLYVKNHTIIESFSLLVTTELKYINKKYYFTT